MGYFKALQATGNTKIIIRDIILLAQDFKTIFALMSIMRKKEIQCEYRLIINYLEDREEFVEEKLKNSGEDIRDKETVRYPLRNDYYNSELSADSLKILFWAFEYNNSKIFNRNVRKKD